MENVNFNPYFLEMSACWGLNKEAMEKQGILPLLPLALLALSAYGAYSGGKNIYEAYKDYRAGEIGGWKALGKGLLGAGEIGLSIIPGVAGVRAGMAGVRAARGAAAAGRGAAAAGRAASTAEAATAGRTAGTAGRAGYGTIETGTAAPEASLFQRARTTLGKPGVKYPMAGEVTVMGGQQMLATPPPPPLQPAQFMPTPLQIPQMGVSGIIPQNIAGQYRPNIPKLSSVKEGIAPVAPAVKGLTSLFPTFARGAGKLGGLFSAVGKPIAGAAKKLPWEKMLGPAALGAYFLTSTYPEMKETEEFAREGELGPLRRGAAHIGSVLPLLAFYPRLFGLHKIKSLGIGPWVTRHPKMSGLLSGWAGGVLGEKLRGMVIKSPMERRMLAMMQPLPQAPYSGLPVVPGITMRGGGLGSLGYFPQQSLLTQGV